MRSGCSSFIVVFNYFVARVLWPLPDFASRAKRCFRKQRTIGLFDTQEAAAHAVNAAIRRAGLEGRRHTNLVVDGQLVPRARKAPGHGVDALRGSKRGRHAATPSTRARRPRRAANYTEDPDFEP